MKYCLIAFFLLLSVRGFSQEPVVDKLVQVTGIVTDVDSNRVVPYVTITNVRTKQLFFADYRGYFSLIAHPGDSLQFSAVGFTTKTQLIAADVNDNFYNLMVKLKSEIVYIQAVQIYPWATLEEFTRSFLALKIADDAMEIAKKNLSGKSLRQMGISLPRDAGEITGMNNRLAHDLALNKNMVQTNPLLNPFAWGRFIQSITNGDKSRQADN